MYMYYHISPPMHIIIIIHVYHSKNCTVSISHGLATARVCALCKHVMTSHLSILDTILGPDIMLEPCLCDGSRIV